MTESEAPPKWTVLADFDGFRVIFAPEAIDDSQPYAIANRLDQIVRRFHTRAGARRAAKRLAADEQRLDNTRLFPTRN